MSAEYQPLDAVATGGNRLAAATDGKSRPRVPDLPCPKCGGDDVTLRWYGPEYGQWCSHTCSYRRRDHFHRHCRRCGYDWVTTDMLDAEEAE